MSCPVRLTKEFISLISGDGPDAVAVERRAWQRDEWASQGRTFRIEELPPTGKRRSWMARA